MKERIYTFIFIGSIWSLCLLFSGCGGEQTQDWEIDQELCEAQGGNAELLQVFNVDTGEQYLEIKCVYDKTPSRAWCKPSNPETESECPEI